MKEIFLNIKQKLSTNKNTSITKSTSMATYYNYMVAVVVIFSILLIIFNFLFLKYIRNNIAFQSVDEVHSVPKINEKKLGAILDRYTAKKQQAEGAILLETSTFDPSK